MFQASQAAYRDSYAANNRPLENRCLRCCSPGRCRALCVGDSQPRVLLLTGSALLWEFQPDKVVPSAAAGLQIHSVKCWLAVAQVQTWL